MSELADSGGAFQEDAARDILNAIAAKDAKSLSLALKRFKEACEEGYDLDEDDRETELGPPSSG